MTSPPTDWDQLPLMLTAEEARAIVRLGRRQCYAAIAAGTIPAVRLGSSLRIPRDGLRRLLEGDQAPAAGLRVLGG